MLTRICLLLTLLAFFLAAACSSSPAVSVDADAGPDATVETAPEISPDVPPDGSVTDVPPDGSVTDVPPDGPALTQPRSYIVHGQLTLIPDQPGTPNPIDPLPKTQDFTMHVDPNAKVVIIGNQFGAARAPMKSSDGLRFETTSTLSIGLPTAGCASNVSYTALTFAVGAAGLTGTAMGQATIIEGDIARGFTARLDLTGIVDTAGPALGDTLVGVDPVAGLFLKASEPLPAAVAAHLVVGGETANLTPFLPQGTGVVTGFHRTLTVALRYGTTYDVVVSPWADLVGNSGQPLPKLTTTAAPPMATEDGFEATTSNPGGARLIGAPELPPISGLKSALLVPRFGSLPNPTSTNNHMTLRLPVQTGDTRVRFSLRPISAFQTAASTFSSALQLAIPGGAITSIPLPSNELLTTQYTNPADNRTTWLGAVRTVEVPLPINATTEVVFDFHLDTAPQTCGLPLPTPGYLIDDLRVE